MPSRSRPPKRAVSITQGCATVSCRLEPADAIAALSQLSDDALIAHQVGRADHLNIGPAAFELRGELVGHGRVAVDDQYAIEALRSGSVAKGIVVEQAVELCIRARPPGVHHILKQFRPTRDVVERPYQ